MFKSFLAWTGVAAMLLAPVQGFAQYRDPGEDVGAAIVGGAVGGALGGVLSGWQQRQRHHEERMEIERWRQLHGGRPLPGEADAGGPPGRHPAPRADGRPPFDGRGRGPGGEGPDAPRGRPAQYGEGRGPEGRGGPGAGEGPRRPGQPGGRPAWQGGEPDEALR